MSLPELPPLTFLLRIRVFGRLLLSLRRHDFRIAFTFMKMNFPNDSPIKRLLKFVGWALWQMVCAIPDAMRHTRFCNNVSPVPIWLKDGNPLENHPWATQPKATLPDETDTVVIGCGLGGCAVAYHWSRQATSGKRLVALDMSDPATGSAGRNEGLVVMGRHYWMVVQTVLPYLRQVRPDLTTQQHEQLAKQFAAHYAHACYRNGDMVEQTIRDERFDCDYAREGWIQGFGEHQQADLATSVQMAMQEGYADWTQITPHEVKQRGGMNVRHNAGFSIAAASFHPAKWCWSLLDRALATGHVDLFTRTKVQDIENVDEYYVVHTARGNINTRHVVLCTESYTPLLMPVFHDIIRPTQTQAASGPGGPPDMQPHVGLSSNHGFYGRHGHQTMVGSDATRVPDHEAGRIQPSRFLTHYLCTELQNLFGRGTYTITNEWSGTVTYTPDQYPIVGTVDSKNLYILGGMAGSGTAISFNGGKCIVNRILGNSSEPDDYPAPYFSPLRLLNPAKHHWPDIEE